MLTRNRKSDIRRLPTELLLLIFDHCTMHELLRLSGTCKFFNEFISMNVVWTKKSRKMLVTNELSQRFRERCNPLLSSRDKCFISYYWRKQIKYQYNVLEHEYCILLPESCLQMSDDMLWWSHKYIIRGFKRTRHCITTADEISNRRIERIGINFLNPPPCFQKFVLCNDAIISSHSNGSIKKWIQAREEGGERISLHLSKSFHHGRLNYVTAIDATPQNIVSGHMGTFKGIKIQKHIDVSEESNNESAITLSDTVPYSLAVDPSGTKLAVGFRITDSINIYDINNAASTSEMSKLDVPDHLHTDWMYYHDGTSGIVWENSCTLLSCGGHYIHKWDLRIGRCVCTWRVHDEKYLLHCISSDYQNTMITGTSHGTVFLWDQRQDHSVTMYDLFSDADLQYHRPTSNSLLKLSKNMPIWSVNFDSSHLYAISHECLYECNFACAQ